jgi:hypothetical protein
VLNLAFPFAVDYLGLIFSRRVRLNDYRISRPQAKDIG